MPSDLGVGFHILSWPSSRLSQFPQRERESKRDKPTYLTKYYCNKMTLKDRVKKTMSLCKFGTARNVYYQADVSLLLQDFLYKMVEPRSTHPAAHGASGLWGSVGGSGTWCNGQRVVTCLLMLVKWGVSNQWPCRCCRRQKL